MAHVTVAGEEEYRRLLREATVLEGRPGDVIYWPASYWHCADNTEGAVALTVAPGLRFQVPVAEGISGNLPFPAPGELSIRATGEAASPTMKRKLRSLSGGAGVCELRREAAKRWLARQTGHFYAQIPAPAPAVMLSEHDALQATKANPVVWFALARDEWVLSANGHALTLSAPPSTLRKLSAMLGRLNHGKPVKIASLQSGFAGRATGSRRTALELLQRIVSWRGARVVEPGG